MNQFGMMGMGGMNMGGMGMGGMPMGGMNMGGMNMGGMNMGMGMNMGGMNMMMNNNEDEEWLKGFQMGVDEVNNTGVNTDPDLNTPGPKFNALFQTTVGTKKNVILSHGTTIDQALRKYLNLVNKPDLVNSNKISFLFNAAKLSFGDQTKVENFFKNITNPKVIVNDTSNLIGA